MNSLNAVPIRQIYERWVGPFHELWTSHLLGLKAAVEQSAGVKRKRTEVAKAKKVSRT